MSLPLEDIKVLDFCQVFAGPATTMHLADQGAQVIKIETPEGDNSRNFVPFPGSNDLSRGFVALNRNKRTIALDLTKPEGLEIAYKLVKWADIVVCNLRPSVPERLKISYEYLKLINPKIIYAGISAYGEKGPDATLPGYDLIAQAKSGITTTRRNADGTPIGSFIYYADMAVAMLGAYAIMVALHERNTTGVGQKIELNLLHNYLALQAVQMVKTENDNPTDQGRVLTALATSYMASDGKYIHVHSASGRQWVNLCKALDLEHLIDDPQFDTHQKRGENAESLFQVIAAVINTKPAKEWESILKEHNSPTSVIQEWQEVWIDDQVVANDMIISYEQPGVGVVQSVNTPFKLSNSNTNDRVYRAAPHFGQHNEEILIEFGYSPNEIDKFKSLGVIKDCIE